MFTRGMIVGVLLLAGCATPQQHADVQHPIGQPLVAGVGDVVLRIEHSSDLPNAFGGADIFGRTTNTGLVEVRYLGLSDGQVILARNDVTIESNETTMTRSGGMLLPSQTTTSFSGMAGTTPMSGSSVTTGYAYVPGPEAETHLREMGWIPIAISPERGSTAVVSGHTIEVISADPSMLRYWILQGTN